MAAGSGNGLSGYRCLASCLAWVVGISFLIVFWFRYTGPVAVAEDSSFLAGIWARISENPFYQLFVAAGAGLVGYALAVRLALTNGTVSWVARLCSGLPETLLDTKEGREVFQEWGANYALAPVRDAAAIFPGLGFLGTVIGVSIAISALDSVVETGDTALLMTGLRSAFDTTFFGLTVSVTLSLLASLIEARATRLGAADGTTTSTEQS